jgi:hypothetical protein
MNAILVRVGVDHSFGGWNAPVDPGTGEFVYVPIPEPAGTRFRRGCRRGYGECRPALDAFATQRGLDLFTDLRFPRTLLRRAMHLDPDFDHLTYGDVGSRRGSEIRHLARGDLLVFYAGMRPVRPCGQRLVYALIGFYVVEGVTAAPEVPPSLRPLNAHTRRTPCGPTDIVVRAQPGKSGRLSRCIPIGEFRDRSYRVRCDVLEAWGGLSVADGYIQRSGRPPRFLDADRFLRWFDATRPRLLAINHPRESSVAADRTARETLGTGCGAVRL